MKRPLILVSLLIRIFILSGLVLSAPASAGTVVEFYNSNLDTYFITADTSEAAAIDSGSAGGGWSRTGNSFMSGGSTSVCRFYGSQYPGPNSHFYTVDASECADLKQLQAATPATQKRWNFESLDFASTPPTNGACPDGTVQVYRAYNNGSTRGVDSNHRITSNLTATIEVMSRGWSYDGVVMCAPSEGGTPASGSQITSSVSGTVADNNGLPISGVTVTAYSNNNNTAVTTTTDATGAYTVPSLGTGNFSDYSVYAGKAGFGFYPSIGDPAGSIGKYDFNGYYRTLIRFPSMPTRDVQGANFIAFRPGDKMASLPRTGQTTSYASGDDYAAHKGVAWPSTRFTDHSDGTVTDHLTGLVWLKNAGCFRSTTWSTALTTANQLASGTCGLTDGSTAGQWRMPNANELESLVDVSQINPAVSAESPFVNVNLTNAYWSSTTYTAGPGNAMAIRFSDGRWINGITADGYFNNAKTTSNNSLWAVKSGEAGTIQLLATGVFSGQGGGSGQSFGIGDDASRQIGAPLTSPRFIDNGDGTLADTVTGLTWLKKADCINKSWSGALSTINSLASGQCGLTDGSTAGQWRMPNRSEMLSLSDRAPTFPQANYFNGAPGGNGITVINPVIFNNFIVSVYYWTSTTDHADTTQAWTIYSCDFGVYNIVKTDTRQYALAVR